MKFYNKITLSIVLIIGLEHNCLAPGKSYETQSTQTKQNVSTKPAWQIPDLGIKSSLQKAYDYLTKPAEISKESFIVQKDKNGSKQLHVTIGANAPVLVQEATGTDGLYYHLDSDKNAILINNKKLMKEIIKENNINIDNLYKGELGSKQYQLLHKQEQAKLSFIPRKLSEFGSYMGTAPRGHITTHIPDTYYHFHSNPYDLKSRMQTSESIASQNSAKPSSNNSESQNMNEID